MEGDDKPTPAEAFDALDRAAGEMAASEDFRQKAAAAAAPIAPAAPEPPPAAPPEPPPAAPPAAPAPEPPKPAEPPAPAPAAPAPDPTDYTEVHKEFEGDAGRLAAALAETRRKLAEKEKAPPAPAAAPAPAAGAPPAGAPATPAEPAKAPERVTPIEYLTKIVQKPDAQRDDEERVMFDEVKRLENQRGQLETVVKAHGEQQTALTEVQGKLTKARTLLEALEEEQKADPDDFKLAERVDKQRHAIDVLERDEDRAQRELDKRTRARDAQDEAYRKNLARLANAAMGRQEREITAHTNSEKFENDVKSTIEEWNKAFPAALTELGLADVPEKTKQRMNKMLINAARLEESDIPDVKAWILTRGKDLRDFADEIRSSTVQTYTQQKKRDASPAAPTGAAASGTPKDEKAPPATRRQNFDEMDRAAGETWNQRYAR